MTTSSKKPLFHKVDCVRLHVDDLDAALTFYRGSPGAPPYLAHGPRNWPQHAQQRY